METEVQRTLQNVAAIPLADWADLNASGDATDGFTLLQRPGFGPYHPRRSQGAVGPLAY
jgi:hypothetical protein